jgi:hypothetical protein
MIRGAIYGSVGVVLAWTCNPSDGILIWLLKAVLCWPLVFLFIAPLLTFAAVPVLEIQRALKPYARGRTYDALALLVGCPFGILVVFVLLKLLGKAGTPWTDPEWASVTPASLAGGAGLGWGCLRSSPGGD